MKSCPVRHARHRFPRFPAEILSLAVWLYFRFTLSFRDVEELLAARGILVSNETVRQRCLKFSQTYSNAVRRGQSKRNDKWYLDKVYLTIDGKIHYLWRAVDQDGNTLDILMQSRCNRHAVKRFFRQLLEGLRYAPRVLITDKLKSYAAAKTHFIPSVEHRQYKVLNNQAEVSPTHPAEGTTDATVQVPGVCTMFPVDPCFHQQLLPVPASSAITSGLSDEAN